MFVFLVKITNVRLGGYFTDLGPGSLVVIYVKFVLWVFWWVGSR